MRTCSNCNRKIEGSGRYCSHCGHELFTVEEAQEALAGLKKMTDSILNVDTSPEGVSQTSVYLDNVTSFIKIYQGLLLQFIEEHKQIGTKQGIFGKRRDSTKAQAYLVLLNIIWSNSEANKNFSLKVVASEVHGCFIIRQRLIKIKDLTETLTAGYSNFFNQKDRLGLEKSQKAIGEISQSVDELLSEIEHIYAEINKFIEA